jgi:hypothetical protein
MRKNSKILGTVDNVVKSDSDGAEYIIARELIDRDARENSAITANDLLIETYRMPPIAESRKRGDFDEILQTSLDSRELFHVPYVDIEYIGDFQTLFDFDGPDGKFRFLNRGYVEEYKKSLKKGGNVSNDDNSKGSKKRTQSGVDFHFEQTELPNVVPISGADGRAWRYQVLTALARQMQVKKMMDAAFVGGEGEKKY